MEDPEIAVSEIAVSEEPWRSGGSDAPPDVQQLARDLATLGEIEEELGALDAALRRIDDDTYWTCEACGQVIDEAVLGAAPLRRRCAPCLPTGLGPLG